MNIVEIFGIVNTIYNILFVQVYGLCGIFYPMFVGGIVSMSVFFLFKSANKSFIALITTAAVILIIPATPYAVKLVAIVLISVSLIFFTVIYSYIR
ncbi:hypothetical protein [Methanococcus sp. CF]